MVVHVSSDSFERVPVQIVQHLDCFHVPEVDDHIGVIAKLGAQCLEFIRRLAKVSV
jgi:hypothetical protein